MGNQASAPEEGEQRKQRRCDKRVYVVGQQFDASDLDDVSLGSSSIERRRRRLPRRRKPKRTRVTASVPKPSSSDAYFQESSSSEHSGWESTSDEGQSDFESDEEDLVIDDTRNRSHAVARPPRPIRSRAKKERRAVVVPKRRTVVGGTLVAATMKEPRDEVRASVIRKLPDAPSVLSGADSIKHIRVVRRKKSFSEEKSKLRVGQTHGRKKLSAALGAKRQLKKPFASATFVKKKPRKKPGRPRKHVIRGEHKSEMTHVPKEGSRCEPARDANRGPDSFHQMEQQEVPNHKSVDRTRAKPEDDGNETHRTKINSGKGELLLLQNHEECSVDSNSQPRSARAGAKADRAMSGTLSTTSPAGRGRRRHLAKPSICIDLTSPMVLASAPRKKSPSLNPIDNIEVLESTSISSQQDIPSRHGRGRPKKVSTGYDVKHAANTELGTGFTLGAKGSAKNQRFREKDASSSLVDNTSRQAVNGTGVAITETAQSTAEKTPTVRRRGRPRKEKVVANGDSGRDQSHHAISGQGSSAGEMLGGASDSQGKRTLPAEDYTQSSLSIDKRKVGRKRKCEKSVRDLDTSATVEQALAQVQVDGDVVACVKTAQKRRLRMPRKSDVQAAGDDGTDRKTTEENATATRWDQTRKVRRTNTYERFRSPSPTKRRRLVRSTPSVLEQCGNLTDTKSEAIPRQFGKTVDSNESIPTKASRPSPPSKEIRSEGESLSPMGNPPTFTERGSSSKLKPAVELKLNPKRRISRETLLEAGSTPGKVQSISQKGLPHGPVQRQSSIHQSDSEPSPRNMRGEPGVDRMSSLPQGLFEGSGGIAEELIAAAEAQRSATSKADEQVDTEAGYRQPNSCSQRQEESCEQSSERFHSPRIGPLQISRVDEEPAKRQKVGLNFIASGLAGHGSSALASVNVKVPPPSLEDANSDVEHGGGLSLLSSIAACASSSSRYKEKVEKPKDMNSCRNKGFQLLSTEASDLERSSADWSDGQSFTAVGTSETPGLKKTETEDPHNIGNNLGFGSPHGAEPRTSDLPRATPGVVEEPKDGALAGKPTILVEAPKAKIDCVSSGPGRQQIKPNPTRSNVEPTLTADAVPVSARQKVGLRVETENGRTKAIAADRVDQEVGTPIDYRNESTVVYSSNVTQVEEDKTGLEKNIVRVVEIDLKAHVSESGKCGSGVLLVGKDTADANNESCRPRLNVSEAKRTKLEGGVEVADERIITTRVSIDSGTDDYKPTLLRPSEVGTKTSMLLKGASRTFNLKSNKDEDDDAVDRNKGERVCPDRANSPGTASKGFEKSGSRRHVAFDNLCLESHESPLNSFAPTLPVQAQVLEERQLIADHPATKRKEGALEECPRVFDACQDTSQPRTSFLGGSDSDDVNDDIPVETRVVSTETAHTTFSTEGRTREEGSAEPENPSSCREAETPEKAKGFRDFGCVAVHQPHPHLRQVGSIQRPKDDLREAKVPGSASRSSIRLMGDDEKNLASVGGPPTECIQPTGQGNAMVDLRREILAPDIMCIRDETGCSVFLYRDQTRPMSGETRIGEGPEVDSKWIRPHTEAINKEKDNAVTPSSGKPVQVTVGTDGLTNQHQDAAGEGLLTSAFATAAVNDVEVGVGTNPKKTGSIVAEGNANRETKTPNPNGASSGLSSNSVTEEKENGADKLKFEKRTEQSITANGAVDGSQAIMVNVGKTLSVDGAKVAVETKKDEKERMSDEGCARKDVVTEKNDAGASVEKFEKSKQQTIAPSTPSETPTNEHVSLIQHETNTTNQSKVEGRTEGKGDNGQSALPTCAGDDKMSFVILKENESMEPSTQTEKTAVRFHVEETSGSNLQRSETLCAGKQATKELECTGLARTGPVASIPTADMDSLEVPGCERTARRLDSAGSSTASSIDTVQHDSGRVEIAPDFRHRCGEDENGATSHSDTQSLTVPRIGPECLNCKSPSIFGAMHRDECGGAKKKFPGLVADLTREHQVAQATIGETTEPHADSANPSPTNRNLIIATSHLAASIHVARRPAAYGVSARAKGNQLTPKLSEGSESLERKAPVGTTSVESDRIKEYVNEHKRNLADHGNESNLGDMDKLTLSGSRAHEESGWTLRLRRRKHYYFPETPCPMQGGSVARSRGAKAKNDQVLSRRATGSRKPKPKPLPTAAHRRQERLERSATSCSPNIEAPVAQSRRTRSQSNSNGLKNRDSHTDSKPLAKNTGMLHSEGASQKPSQRQPPNGAEGRPVRSAKERAYPIGSVEDRKTGRSPAEPAIVLPPTRDSIRQAVWESMLLQMLDYKKQHGTFCPPRKENPKLYRWVKRQANSCSNFIPAKADAISNQRYRRLIEVGLVPKDGTVIPEHNEIPAVRRLKANRGAMTKASATAQKAKREAETMLPSRRSKRRRVMALSKYSLPGESESKAAESQREQAHEASGIGTHVSLGLEDDAHTSKELRTNVGIESKAPLRANLSSVESNVADIDACEEPHADVNHERESEVIERQTRAETELVKRVNVGSVNETKVETKVDSGKEANPIERLLVAQTECVDVVPEDCTKSEVHVPGYKTEDGEQSTKNVETEETVDIAKAKRSRVDVECAGGKIGPPKIENEGCTDYRGSGPDLNVAPEARDEGGGQGYACERKEVSATYVVHDAADKEIGSNGDGEKEMGNASDGSREVDVDSKPSCQTRGVGRTTEIREKTNGDGKTSGEHLGTEEIVKISSNSIGIESRKRADAGTEIGSKADREKYGVNELSGVAAPAVNCAPLAVQKTRKECLGRFTKIQSKADDGELGAQAAFIAATEEWSESAQVALLAPRMHAKTRSEAVDERNTTNAAALGRQDGQNDVDSEAVSDASEDNPERNGVRFHEALVSEPDNEKEGDSFQKGIGAGENQSRDTEAHFSAKRGAEAPVYCGFVSKKSAIRGKGADHEPAKVEVRKANSEGGSVGIIRIGENTSGVKGKSGVSDVHVADDCNDATVGCVGPNTELDQDKPPTRERIASISRERADNDTPSPDDPRIASALTDEGTKSFNVATAIVPHDAIVQGPTSSGSDLKRGSKGEPGQPAVSASVRNVDQSDEISGVEKPYIRKDHAFVEPQSSQVAAAAASGVADETGNGLLKESTQSVSLTLPGQASLPVEETILGASLSSVSDETKKPSPFAGTDPSKTIVSGTAATLSDDDSTSEGELGEDSDYCCRICGLPKKNHLCWLNDTEDPIVATAESNAESFMAPVGSPSPPGRTLLVGTDGAGSSRPKRHRKPITRYQGGRDEEQTLKKAKTMKASTDSPPTRRSTRRSQSRWNVLVEDGF